MRSGTLKGLLAAAAAVAMVAAGMASAQDKPIVGLITKTETNPFFVKMREGAQAKADELGLELHAPAAGKFDGDNDGQVAAIENHDLGRRQGLRHRAERIRRRSCRPSRRRATPG